MSDRDRSLEIKTPCPKSWNELVGDDKKRFCSECSLHVHNSPGLTRSEAHAIASEAESGRVCMRIVRDANGQPIYLDSSCGSAAVEAAPEVTRPLGRAATWLLAAGAGLLAACRDALPLGHGEGPGDTNGGQEGPLMGAVAPNWDPSDEGCSLPEDPTEQPIETMGEAVFEELGDVAYPVEDGTTCAEPPGDPALEPTHEVLGRIAPPQPEKQPEPETPGAPE